MSTTSSSFHESTCSFQLDDDLDASSGQHNVIDDNDNDNDSNDVRRVRFSVVEEFEYDKPDFTDDEIADLWYTMEEMVGLVKEELQLCHDNNKAAGRCWRGLEHMKGGVDNRAERVSAILDSILDAYDELSYDSDVRQTESDREEALRGECRALTRDDRKRAYKYGLRDASIAEGIYKEEEEKKSRRSLSSKSTSNRSKSNSSPQRSPRSSGRKPSPRDKRRVKRNRSNHGEAEDDEKGQRQRSETPTRGNRRPERSTVAATEEQVPTLSSDKTSNSTGNNLPCKVAATKKQRPRPAAMGTMETSVLVVIMLVGVFSADAFVVSPPTLSSPFAAAAQSSLTTLPAAAVPFNLEEVLFNAQSAASDLASVSLSGDPSNLFASMPILYAAGLLTSFSPCVWGLLPLTMSYISQAAGERDDRQAAWPTLAFAAGLAAVFCTLGVVVATLGGVFGGTVGNSIWLPLASNAICFVMGMQLLGFIQVALPSFLQTTSFSTNTSSGSDDEPILLDGTGQILASADADKDTSSSSNQASLLRTFLLGGSSALVASPCATPVLTSILAYVASAQNAGIGAILLLGYTLGYSTPLLLVASTGGQALVNLRSMGSDNSGGNANLYGKIAPWVTPLTGGVLLWYGTSGLLLALFGDPSLMGLAPVLE